MKQDNYLIKYYENNNEIKNRIRIKRKIIIKTQILLLCALIYFIIINFSNFSKFKGEIEVLNSLAFFEVIMNISLSLGVLGVVLSIMFMIFPHLYEKIIDTFSFKVKKIIYTVLDWFSVVPICIVIAIFLFSYVFIITPVSGDSMRPNIQNAENVLVQYNKKLDYGKVVVIEVNEEDSIYEGETKYFIKRIIGMPGDKVKWVNNKLYINDELFNEPYFEDGYFDKQMPVNQFNGIFEYKDEDGKIIKTEVIPEGYYFVLGDNRPISNDSRDIGLIKEDNIIGVATHHMNGIIPNGEII